MSSPKDGDVLWVDDEQMDRLKALAAEAAFEADGALRDRLARSAFLELLKADPYMIPFKVASQAYALADAMLTERARVKK